MKKIIFTLILSTLIMAVHATTYYVSSTGNDNNNGKSIGDAWQTISKVNGFALQPGDVVLFQAGATFTGSIQMNAAKGGTDGNPITFNSYGGGKATVSSGTQNGIYVGNAGNVTIKNLIVKGAGYMATTMWMNGIEFYMENAVANDLKNIIIDNVEVYGYGGMGILIGTQSDRYGYSHVKLTNSLLHDNGMGGFQIRGSWDNRNSLIRYSNKDVYVGNCKAYYNHGRADYRDNWSGSGILISGTVTGTVEYCEAYENGKDNASSSSGPIGIWMDNSKYVTIQYCISHHNKGGGAKTDGGGFDIDGGCYGSVIQECDSYENEGCGYGFFQKNTANAWSNDTVRNNTSTNDARNKKYGALSFLGTGNTFKLTNAEIYGNRISMDKEGLALTFAGENFSNIQIHDNAFCIVAPATLTKSMSQNVTNSNNTFPCLALSIKTGSFKVKRVL